MFVLLETKCYTVSRIPAFLLSSFHYVAHQGHQQEAALKVSAWKLWAANKEANTSCGDRRYCNQGGNTENIVLFFTRSRSLCTVPDSAQQMFKQMVLFFQRQIAHCMNKPLNKLAVWQNKWEKLASDQVFIEIPCLLRKQRGIIRGTKGTKPRQSELQKLIHFFLLSLHALLFHS